MSKITRKCERLLDLRTHALIVFIAALVITLILPLIPSNWNVDYFSMAFVAEALCWGTWVGVVARISRLWSEIVYKGLNLFDNAIDRYRHNIRKDTLWNVEADNK